MATKVLQVLTVIPPVIPQLFRKILRIGNASAHRLSYRGCNSLELL
jgi:hypothetical protein